MPATDLIDRLRRCLLAYTKEHSTSIHYPVINGRCQCGQCIEAAKLVAKLTAIMEQT